MEQRLEALENTMRETCNVLKELTAQVEKLNQLCVDISWWSRGYEIYRDGNGNVEYVWRKC
jgi:hypothetical protein